MEMNQQLKDSSMNIAGVFLDTMPEKDFERFSKQKLHHQLSYFFCWCELMRDEHEA